MSTIWTPTAGCMEAHDLATVRNWARNRLGIDATLADRDLPRAILELVEELDDLDDETFDAAAVVLMSPSLEIPEELDWVLAEAIRLRRASEIREFASRFFSLPTLDRSEEWARLSAQVKDNVVLTAWLQDLRPWLSTTIPDEGTISDPQVREIVRLVRTGALLPGVQGAAIRRQLDELNAGSVTMQDVIREAPAIRQLSTLVAMGPQGASPVDSLATLLRHKEWRAKPESRPASKQASDAPAKGGLAKLCEWMFAVIAALAIIFIYLIPVIKWFAGIR